MASNSNFPSQIDGFTDPVSGQSEVGHALQHDEANDALLAIETLLGTTNTTSTSTHEYWVNALRTGNLTPTNISITSSGTITASSGLTIGTTAPTATSRAAILSDVSGDLILASGTNGAQTPVPGWLYLRPNGQGSTVGQWYLTASGNMISTGYLQSGGGVTFSSGSYTSIPTGIAGIGADSSNVLYIGSNSANINLRPSGVSSTAGQTTLTTAGVLQVNSGSSAGTVQLGGSIGQGSRIRWGGDGTGYSLRLTGFDNTNAEHGGAILYDNGTLTTLTATGATRNTLDDGSGNATLAGNITANSVGIRMPTVALRQAIAASTNPAHATQLLSATFTTQRANPYVEVKIAADLSVVTSGFGALSVYATVNGTQWSGTNVQLGLATILDNIVTRSVKQTSYGNVLTAAAGATVTVDVVVFRYATGGSVNFNSGDLEVVQW